MGSRGVLAVAAAVAAALVLAGVLALALGAQGMRGADGRAAAPPRPVGRTGPAGEVELADAALPGPAAARADRVPRSLPRAERVGRTAGDAAAAPQAERPRAGSETPRAPAAEDACALSGRVRSRAGDLADLQRLLTGHLRLELMPDGDPRTRFLAQLSAEREPDGTRAIAFRFPPAPAGRYVLTVSCTGPRRVTPARLALALPAPSLDLWYVDDVDALALGFRVLDAGTLEPIDGWSAWSLSVQTDPDAGVLFHAGPLALDDVPLDAEFTWRLWADGYAPATGDERAFTSEEDGRWIAEVRLARGFGRRFVALGRDPSMRLLAGAEIELDGRPAGRTGPDGALDVQLESAPQRYRATYGALSAEGPVPPAEDAAGAAMVTVMVLEPR